MRNDNLNKLISLKKDFYNALENGNIEEAKRILEIIDNKYIEINGKSFKELLSDDELSQVNQLFRKEKHNESNF